MAKIEQDDFQAPFSLTSHSEGGGQNALVVGKVTIWLDLAELRRLASESAFLVGRFDEAKREQVAKREANRAANDAMDELVRKTEGL